MKYALITVLFLSVALISCDWKSEQKTKKLSQYYIVCRLKNNNRIQTDTTYIEEYNDSTAYLKGKVKFGRYLTDWKISKYLKTPEPISFAVINEGNENILENLTNTTIHLIDSIAEIKIDKEKNAIYDSTGSIRIMDTTQKGLLNYIDSSLHNK